jgi:hypothetical protein
VSGSEEVNGGLGDADVALDADNDARKRASDLETVEGFLDIGGPLCCQQTLLPLCLGGVWGHVHHGEQRLVDMADSLDAAGCIQLQLGARLAESRLVLRGGEDGYLQDLA